MGGNPVASATVYRSDDQKLGDDDQQNQINDAAGGVEFRHASFVGIVYGETKPMRWAMSLKKIRTCAIGLARTNSLFM